MTVHPQMTGLAALTICESLLLALMENDVLDRQEIRGLLKDAASTHRQAASAAEDPEAHLAAEAIIESIINRKNSVRGSV